MHLHLNVREWFDKVNGNTYHTVGAIFIMGDGTYWDEHTETHHYGYGDHFWHTTGELILNKMSQWVYDVLFGLEDDNHRSAYDVRPKLIQERGITVTVDRVTVNRKRDLYF